MKLDSVSVAWVALIQLPGDANMIVEPIHSGMASIRAVLLKRLIFSAKYKNIAPDSGNAKASLLHPVSSPSMHRPADLRKVSFIGSQDCDLPSSSSRASDASDGHR